MANGDGGGLTAEPARGTVLLLAAACGVVVANLYVAQPLVGLIGPELGLDTAAAGLVVTLAQLGYCAGLLLLVPLGDLVENRQLVTLTLLLAVLALTAAALSGSASVFLGASLLIGVGSSAAQMLVPLAAHLAPEAARGRVVGNVMAGLVLGVLLARPLSSLVADTFGWRAVFGASAALTGGLALLLARLLPERRPSPGAGYVALLRLLPPILLKTPVLRRRSAYQAALFCGFSLFWTAVPLHLSGPAFELSQRGIALFALAGAAGALVAPVAGRLADRGWTRAGTGAALLAVLAAFAVAGIRIARGPGLGGRAAGRRRPGQPRIRAAAHLRPGPGTPVPAERPLRRDALPGGAAGSALAGVLMAHAGWRATAGLGAAITVLTLLFFATEFRGGPPGQIVSARVVTRSARVAGSTRLGEHWRPARPGSAPGSTARRVPGSMRAGGAEAALAAIGGRQFLDHLPAGAGDRHQHRLGDAHAALHRERLGAGVGQNHL